MNINVNVLSGTIRRAYLDGETAQEIAHDLDLPTPSVEAVVKDLTHGARRDAQMCESFAKGECVKSIASRWGVRPVVVLRAVGASEQAKALRKSRTKAISGGLQKRRHEKMLKHDEESRQQRAELARQAAQERRAKVCASYGEGLSVRDCARKAGCSITTARKDLIASGLVLGQTRSAATLTDEHLADVAARFLSGCTVADLARLYGMLDGAIAYRLLRVGLGPQGLPWVPDAHELRDSLMRWGVEGAREEYGADERMLRVWMMIYKIEVGDDLR